MKNFVRISLLACSALALSAFQAAAQQSVADAQSISGYVLGPDDQIVIRELDAPELSDKPVLIGANGDLTLPLIGRVKAGGLTVEQLESQLNARFKEFIKDPEASVTVTEFRSEPVSVFGAVTKPGVVQLRGPTRLYEVLSMAGGPLESAGSSLTLTRSREYGDIPLSGATADPTGQFSTVELNVQEVLAEKNPAVNIQVKPHDVISVSESTSNLVYVVGDVQHAGGFTLAGAPNATVLRALSLAGGLGRTAKPQHARIIREITGTQAGVSEIAVNLKQILSGKAQDVQLRSNDVLVVPTSSTKEFVTDFIPNTMSAAAAAAIYHF